MIFAEYVAMELLQIVDHNLHIKKKWFDSWNIDRQQICKKMVRRTDLFAE